MSHVDALLSQMPSYQRCVDCFVGVCKPRLFFGAAEGLGPEVMNMEVPIDAELNLFPEPLREPSGPSREQDEKEREHKQNGPVRPVFVPRKEAFGGGEMYRPIYCGMDPDNKPKNAIYGNRLQCYRKGFYYGTRRARHG